MRTVDRGDGDYGAVQVTVPALLVPGKVRSTESIAAAYHVTELRCTGPDGRRTLYTLCFHRDLSHWMIRAYLRHVAAMAARRVHEHYMNRSNAMSTEQFTGCWSSGWRTGVGDTFRLFPAHGLLRTVNRVLSNDKHPLQVYPTSAQRFFIVPDRRRRAVTQELGDADVASLISRMADEMEDDEERNALVAERTWLEAEEALDRGSGGPMARHELSEMRIAHGGRGLLCIQRPQQTPPSVHTQSQRAPRYSVIKGERITTRVLRADVDLKETSPESTAELQQEGAAAEGPEDTMLVTVSSCNTRCAFGAATADPDSSHNAWDTKRVLYFHEHGRPMLRLSMHAHHPALEQLGDNAHLLF